MISILMFLVLVGSNQRMAQTPQVMFDRVQIAQSSKAVVVAELEEIAPVIKADEEITKTRTAANGKTLVEFRNPADFMLGRVAKFRVKSAYRSEGTLQSGGTFSLFLPGAYSTENEPILLKGQTYLLCLEPVKVTKEMKRALVQPPNDPEKRVAFNARTAYVVVQNSRGALKVTSATQKEVDRVRDALQEK